MMLTGWPNWFDRQSGLENNRMLPLNQQSLCKSRPWTHFDLSQSLTITSHSLTAQSMCDQCVKMVRNDQFLVPKGVKVKNHWFESPNTDFTLKRCWYPCFLNPKPMTVNLSRTSWTSVSTLKTPIVHLKHRPTRVFLSALLVFPAASGYKKLFMCSYVRSPRDYLWQFDESGLCLITLI